MIIERTSNITQKLIINITSTVYNAKIVILKNNLEIKYLKLTIKSEKRINVNKMLKPLYHHLVLKSKQIIPTEHSIRKLFHPLIMYNFNSQVKAFEELQRNQ